MSADDPTPRWWTWQLDDAYSIEYLQITSEGYDGNNNNEVAAWTNIETCPLISNIYLYATEFFVSNDSSY